MFASAGAAWPPLDLQSSSDDEILKTLVDFLQVRIRKERELARLKAFEKDVRYALSHQLVEPENCAKYSFWFIPSTVQTFLYVSFFT